MSIAFFNSFGVKVTKRLSGAARAAIDATRTLFIWVAAVGLGWEPLSPPLRVVLQVLGFAVLVSGTSLYNELLRACLPTPPPDDEEVRVCVICISELRCRPAQGCVYGELNVPVQEEQPVVGAPAPATGYAVRPRPIKHEYSLARSMRAVPQVRVFLNANQHDNTCCTQALSPHSLSSVRFSQAYGPLDSDAQLDRSEDASPRYRLDASCLYTPTNWSAPVHSTRTSWLSRGGAADDPVLGYEDEEPLEAPLLGGRGTRTPPR